VASLRCLGRGLVDVGRRFLDVGHFAVAAALSITTIEESGKLAVERFRLLGSDSIDMKSDSGMRVMAQWKPGARAFPDHFTKHVMAATAGASVNPESSRLTSSSPYSGYKE
jgi:AbiV family abortive infection protein